MWTCSVNPPKFTPMKVEELVEEVSQLPDPEKAEIIRRVLERMEQAREEQELLDEAERRDQEMDSDPSCVLSENEFLASFAARLGKTA
jgi:DNA-binding protein H-NS